MGGNVSCMSGVLRYAVTQMLLIVYIVQKLGLAHEISQPVIFKILLLIHKTCETMRSLRLLNQRAGLPVGLRDS